MTSRRQRQPRYCISLRGPTYACVKAAAGKQGIGISKLAEQLLAESEAIQMTPHAEYQLLERLVAKRRGADKDDDDLLERMHVVLRELSDAERQLVKPPPPAEPYAATRQLVKLPPETFFTTQPADPKPSPPADIKPSPHQPKAEGRGYIEF